MWLHNTIVILVWSGHSLVYYCDPDLVISPYVICMFMNCWLLYICPIKYNQEHMVVFYYTFRKIMKKNRMDLHIRDNWMYCYKAARNIFLVLFWHRTPNSQILPWYRMGHICVMPTQFKWSVWISNKHKPSLSCRSKGYNNSKISRVRCTIFYCLEKRCAY